LADAIATSDDPEVRELCQRFAAAELNLRNVECAWAVLLKQALPGPETGISTSGFSLPLRNSQQRSSGLIDMSDDRV
jgi:hypothetical protein